MDGDGFMNSLKILVVDDEARLRKLVKDFLIKKNYEVIEACDGEEAIELFVENKDISLIILDVMMPRMDGRETIKEIRKLSNVPVIMLTAKAEHLVTFRLNNLVISLLLRLVNEVFVSSKLCFDYFSRSCIY